MVLDDDFRFAFEEVFEALGVIGFSYDASVVHGDRDCGFRARPGKAEGGRRLRDPHRRPAGNWERSAEADRIPKGRRERNNRGLGRVITSMKHG